MTRKHGETDTVTLNSFCTEPHTRKTSDKRETYWIYIPAAIPRILNIGSDSILEVGIRELSEKEAEKEYGYKRRTRLPYKGENRVTCPRCGKPGNLGITTTRLPSGTYATRYRIRHYGNGKKTVCYLKKEHRTPLIKETEEKMRKTIE